ncbi:N-acetylglucosamine-6-phosphate deacetylase [Kocuria sp. p3-SID1433]|uniref:N-acetylglucosamine-6-phosphate deacetylase n=1 Tax=unclassified Kocuria TaxID=2649579 RepID=UPI0021A56081|nr:MULTISPECIES: N-acetylglucosamine-6-phosphate deacetylase [unclassified Kocuria]MCT1602655.1 N-acetylglucosamine-6-phosphate deacetylase [Kocuria sp. p3-SID1428]MCT2180496.1 N-acetylglucosamine-6-phosphate deacetylase [Kocuria sp. p3-SID1433]
MTERIFHSTTVVLPSGPAREAWVVLDGERISSVLEGASPADLGGAPVEELGDRLLAPGFVDLHVHGGGGGAFADGTDGAAAALVAHRAAGTTTSMASLVTDTIDSLEQQIRALVPLVRAGELAGIHLEGPWLAEARCGAHEPGLLQDPRPEDLERLLAAGQGTVRMVTLAPERDGALEAIRLLNDRDVIAAIGHTDAADAVIAQALDAGASVATHLFNAMPSIHHRTPGPIPRLLTDPRVSVELIADGVHIQSAVLRMAIEASAGPWLLITDAMAAAAAPDGAYRLGPLEVDVVDSVARIRSTGAIAGSTLSLDRAVRFAIQEVGIEVADAVRAASQAPADLLGRPDLGRIQVGARADLVVLDQDGVVERVIRRGVDL